MVMMDDGDDVATVYRSPTKDFRLLAIDHRL
jgi:hypothetical protein